MKSVSEHSFDQDEIHIFTTGGTIEGLDYDNPDDRATQATVSLKDFLTRSKVSFKYTIESVFSKDSRFINDQDRQHLANQIGASNLSKILVTHGTLSMVETAKFLGKKQLDKTVVLVGAFVLGTKPDTDAPFNLGFAISALQLLNPGVYIAMHGNIFSWQNVNKNVERNRFEENA